jgi:pimeloyl-ACP methyl ester carboxylesterase
VATFALIHGGGHGGWCWELLVPELEARGHAAVAPDLPIDEVAAGALEYAHVVVASLEGVTGDVVVVGHSLGGMTAPVVAALRPVVHMVFLGAMVPAPGEVYEEFLATRAGAVPSAAGDAKTWEEQGLNPPRPWEAALHLYYHDVAEPTARRAWGRLRPQGGRPFQEPSPLREWPAVSSSYVLMREDRSVDQDFSRWLARERLGVEPLELPGGHSPFLSRPSELADLLCELVPDAGRQALRATAAGA